MPSLIVIASVEPHDRDCAGGEGMDVASDGIRGIILIELQGSGDDDAVILGIILVIVTAIQYYHATVTILYVGVRVGIDGRKYVLDDEGAPSLISDGIAKGYGICRGFHRLLADIETENARVLVVVDDLAMLEEVDWWL